MNQAEQQEIEEPFYPIPSDLEGKGWEKFLQYRNKLLTGDRKPTDREIRILHALTTLGVELPKYSNHILEDAAANLLIRRRSDREVFSVLQKIRQGVFSQERAEKGEILPNSRCKVSMPRRGNCRRYGYRIRENGHERIYAPHGKPINDGLFVGLSENLEEVFQLLCSKFEQLEQENAGQDLDTRLKVIIFLQLWGASIIHPFFDGNGRAFGAKLVLDLNRLGITLDKIPELGEINPDLGGNALALTGERFLVYFLQKNHLPLINREDVALLLAHSQLYSRYMEILERGIREGISYGINPPRDYDAFLGSGVNVVKLFLSREGLIDRTLYENSIEELTEAARASRIQQ